MCAQSSALFFKNTGDGGFAHPEDQASRGLRASMNHNEQLLRSAAFYGAILLTIVFAALLWKG